MSNKPESNDQQRGTQYSDYESHRLQLAEIARRSFELAQRFPGLCFQLLEADGPIAWEKWIANNAGQQQEEWDIYPAWCYFQNPTMDELRVLEGQNARYCGRYHMAEGDLGTARRELEALGEIGMQTLLAIKRDIENKAKLKQMCSCESLVLGHRGLLDAVKNSGELYRCPLVNTEQWIWGFRPTDSDLLSHATALGHAMHASKGDQKVSVLAVEIRPDIFTAIFNTLGLWLQAARPAPVSHVSCDFEPIQLPGTSLPDRALEHLGLTRQEPEKPHWDARTGKLTFANQLIKQYKKRTDNQCLVLSAFEEEGWPSYIDDPIPPKDEMDPKQRLRQTVAQLKRCHITPGLIRFETVNSGQGVAWVSLLIP